MGQGRGALALSGAAWAPAATATADRFGEVTMAAATVVAVLLMALTLPALLRRRRAVGRAGVTPALVILTGAAAIAFVAYLAFIFRCNGPGCRIPGGDTVAGLYPWWRDDRSWQWGGQLALAGVALALSSAALALAVRDRRVTPHAVTLARVAVAGWVIVAFVIPAAWEVFAIR